MRQLRLPARAVLPEDLSRDGEFLAPIQQGRADDDLVAQNGLVVVDVRGAVGTVVAVDGFACGGKEGG